MNVKTVVSEYCQCGVCSKMFLLTNRIDAEQCCKKPDPALEFLMRTCYGEYRIVSSNDLTTEQIAEAQAKGLFFVAEGGFGWALLPWALTTDKDKIRDEQRITKLNRQIASLEQDVAKLQ